MNFAALFIVVMNSKPYLRVKEMYNMDKPKEHWTKRELTIAKNPIAALAKAVIWQWHLDGEPEADREAINYWEKVLENAR